MPIVLNKEYPQFMKYAAHTTPRDTDGSGL